MAKHYNDSLLGDLFDSEVHKFQICQKSTWSSHIFGSTSVVAPNLLQRFTYFNFRFNWFRLEKCIYCEKTEKIFLIDVHLIQTQPESTLIVMSRRQSCCKNTLYNAVNSFENESNPLTFWCSQRKKMPILANIAATIFWQSSAESERHYSAFNARHIITLIRNRLCPDVVEAVSINLESYKNSLLWIKFSEVWLFSSNLLGPGSEFIWVTRVQGQQKWPSFISAQD